MATLRGARVALLEARMSGELAGMVARLGGLPYAVPAVREAPLQHPEEVGHFLEKLCADRFHLVVLLTGAAVTALLREADRMSRLQDALAALRRTTTVCRGPKPVAVLRRNDVPVDIAAPEPHTAHELLEALEGVDLAGKVVGLLHYGERAQALADALAARGARVDELCLYEWVLPDDVDAIKRLVEELIAGEVDAVAFTSQIQCRHLFQIADQLGHAAALTDALNNRVVVAAVGPVSASALRGFGVVPHVLPSHPKMGPMLVALADYFELTDRRVPQRNA